jgi:hypothetical protein
MTTTEKQRFFLDHLPHRVNLLIAFRERYAGRNPDKSLDPERFRDLFRCAKDIAMLMVRFFCGEVGLKVRKRQNTVQPCTPRGTVYGATKADLGIISKDKRFDSLLLVLIAANRAVAHIAPSDVDHGVTDAALVSAIDLVEELVRSHIYAPSNIALDDAMRLPNNRM